MDDVLGDVFRATRLTACVYFHRRFAAPWAMEMPDTGQGQFHVITDGDCIVEAGRTNRRCRSGDILFFPRGSAHRLSDAPGRNAVPGPQVLASFTSERPMFASGPAATRMICGHFEYRNDPAHPLFESLPDLICINGTQGRTAAGTVLSLLMAEIDDAAEGQNSVVERFAEILLIKVLRHYAETNPDRVGIVAAMRDARLSQALRRIHRDFSRPLALADLAEASALSRSAFAERFREVAGLPPIEYLARWRMLNAAELLQRTDLAIITIAENVGYDSDIAFARAFKRLYGMTPVQYRRGQVDAMAG